MTSRFNNTAVKNCAKSTLSRFGSMWIHFSDEIRDALIDSAIMDEIRRADSADSAFSFTATNLLTFRLKVVRLLEAGVFIGKSKHGLSFDRDREERRVRSAYERGRLASKEQD